MGTPARAREGRWGYFLYKRGVAAANQREGYNGRRGDGDKTTFGHTHKPAVINMLKRTDAES